MSTTQATWQPKYLLGELRPGETHFVKGADWKTVRTHLYYARHDRGLLKDAKIIVEPSRNGTLIRREA